MTEPFRDAAMAARMAHPSRGFSHWHADPSGPGVWHLVIVEDTPDGPITHESDRYVSTDELAYMDPPRYGHLVTPMRRWQHRMRRVFHMKQSVWKLRAMRWGLRP